MGGIIYSPSKYENPSNLEYEKSKFLAGKFLLLVRTNHMISEDVRREFIDRFENKEEVKVSWKKRGK